MQSSNQWLFLLCMLCGLDVSWKKQNGKALNQDFGGAMQQAAGIPGGKLGGGPPQGSTLSDHDTRFLAILGPGFGQALHRVRVDPFPAQVSQSSPKESNQEPKWTPSPLDIILELEHKPMERPTDSVQDIAASPSLLPVGATKSPPPLFPASGAAPLLPRRQRLTRYRSRLLAPLDEARRILSQVEMQRAAADTAQAQALHLIGQNLGRLASAAERYLDHSFEPV